MFRGKILYFIEKSHIRRFDSAIKSIANLEYVVSLESFIDDSYEGVTLERFLAKLPLLQPIDNLFYRQNSKMTAK